MEDPEKDHQNTNPCMKLFFFVCKMIIYSFLLLSLLSYFLIVLNYSPSSEPSKEVAAEDTEDKKENWLVYYTPTGIEYFYNVITKQSTYEKPDCLKTNIEKELSVFHFFLIHDREQVFNWKEFATNEGIPYWYNTQTKESSWNKPQELIDYEAKLHKKPKAPVEKKEEDPKMILNNEYTKLLEQLFGLYSVEEVQQHFFQLLNEKNNQQDQIQQDIRYYVCLSYSREMLKQLPKNEKQRQYYDQQYQIKTRSNKNKSIFEVVEIKNELTHYVMEHQFPIKTSSYKDLQSFIQSNQLQIHPFLTNLQMDSTHSFSTVSVLQ